MVPLVKASREKNFFADASSSFSATDPVALEDDLIGLLSSRKFKKVLLTSPDPGRPTFLEDLWSSPPPDYATSSDSPAATQTAEPNPIPIYVIAIVGTLFFIMSTAILYYLCRCLIRKKKRENHLANITPTSKDPRMLAGVRANQPIQFVVPTTIVLNENTEDSVSETDYSSSGAKTLPVIVDRRRRGTLSYQINPEDLQHGLYVGVKAASEKGAFLGDLGKVGFSMSYNAIRHQLIVKLIGATGLPCHFLKTTANPCAKVVLLPDRTTKYLSKVQKNTVNPTFNEVFTFTIRRDDLREKKLKISVWDYDKFSRKCLIGQVVYCLADSGLSNPMSANPSTGDIWIDLKSEVTTHSSSGEMLFSLCYNPDASNLTLTVLKVRGLSTQQDKATKELSVYAKVTLYVRRKLVRTKKTPLRKKTPEVEFSGSSFDIHVPHPALGDVDLLVTLCERAPGLGPRRVLGRTQVGGNCLCDQGLQHWQDMLLSPRSTSAQWHRLCG